MVAYEFYSGNHKEGYDLVGILPERRKKTERVTHESIMKWAKIVFSDTLDVTNIYFVPISLEKSMTGFYFPRL